MKSIEYLILQSILENLNGGIERGEIDTKFDQVMQTYVKEHRAIIKSCPTNLNLPHPETFYSELFGTAITLVS